VFEGFRVNTTMPWVLIKAVFVSIPLKPSIRCGLSAPG
jgi:hypothetical protein